MTIVILASCERQGADVQASADSGAGHGGPVVTPESSSTTPIASARPDSAGADSSGTSPEGAVLVVREYLAALRAKDYALATALWEAGGSDSAGDSAALRRSRGATTVTAFQVGAPGRIEGAAGSRYIEVPATVQMTARGGTLSRRAVVTLRRAVVDGATAAQRRWHIARVSWSDS